MTRAFGEFGTLEEPILSELLMNAAAPHPFADAISFVALAAEIPLRDWRDVVLPRYGEVRCTPAYQSARYALADACDAVRYPVAREVVMRRTAEVAHSIEWCASKVPKHSAGLSADAARRVLTSAALAVRAREHLRPADVTLLCAPFESMLPRGAL
jgi:hypothetical protein